MVTKERFAEYKGRSVLITGGLGFIGSNLAHALVDIGDVEVTILDALVPGQGGNLYNIHDIRDRVNVHISNIGNNSVVNHLVGGVDYIFNLAAGVGHLDSMENPLLDLELNCASQLTLLEACRSFNPNVKIVFTSTRQVYGTPIYLPLDELHRIEPPDVNGINKFATEQYHALYRRVYDLRSVCLRLTNTYGPRQMMLHDRHSFIAWFIRQAMDGGVIELFGEGKQRRDLNYVDDVIEALLLVGASEAAEGEVFNLGGPEPVLLSTLAEELINITGRGSVRCLPFPPERQSIEIGNAYSNYNKIHSVVDWHPRTPLHEGLSRTIQFYQRNRDHYWSIDADTLSRSQTIV